MPLPFALDHVNLWVLEDGDGWAQVDTGLGNDDNRALWEQLLAGDLAGRPFTRLLCTHYHPDHMGLAGWLEGRIGVPLTATLGEWSSARMSWLDTGPDHIAHKLAHYRRLGYSDEQLAQMQAGGNVYRSRIAPPPADFRRISDGDRISIGGREWRVMTFGGHSPEHACFWCEEAKILIAGDQVLPKISPIVGIWPDEPFTDQLSLFLAALERLKELPEDTLVLPAHGHPFRTLGARCEELARHHEERLDAIAAACPEPATVLDIQRVVFRRPLDQHQTAFASAEILAHLRRLELDGRVRRLADGAAPWRFEAVRG
ncbi:MAG: MBL fold metallo-hydrolase [Solirubrobacterales bacterium]